MANDRADGTGKVKQGTLQLGGRMSLGKTVEGGQGASDRFLPDPEIPQEAARVIRKSRVISVVFSPLNQHIKRDPIPTRSITLCIPPNNRSAKVKSISVSVAAEQLIGGTSCYRSGPA